MPLTQDNIDDLLDNLPDTDMYRLRQARMAIEAEIARHANSVLSYEINLRHLTPAEVARAKYLLYRATRANLGVAQNTAQVSYAKLMATNLPVRENECLAVVGRIEEFLQSLRE